MNLQEQYKRLFKSRISSNDSTVLLESRYNVKVTKHEYDPELEYSKFRYSGTISGPDIPNGTKFTARGAAGDVDNISSLPDTGDLATLQAHIFFPNSDTSTDYYAVNIVNPNELDNTDENEHLDGLHSSYKDGHNWDAHMKMTKEKKDELSKILNDAVVKYALSKGLTNAVAEKSGGTFNLKAVIDAKKKKKPKRTGPEIAVFDGEVDGRDRSASGTVLVNNKELEWELETDDGMTSIYVDGKSIEDTDPDTYDAILTAVNDEGYELEEQASYKKATDMNLQEQYKRLFKSRF